MPVVSRQERPGWIDRLDAVLSRQGRSLRWLSEEAEIPYSTLRNYVFTPETHHITVERAQRIARALQLPYELLFEEATS